VKRICLFLVFIVAGCAGNPRNAKEAQELYLQGKAIQDKEYASAQEARTQWQSARELYTRALELNPPKGLTAYIRSSLANVAYFLDDYPLALEQWSAAYPNLPDPDQKVWALYRIALCEQRLGHFDRADQTFAQVQKEFPGTIPAARAREKQGVHQFELQLAAVETGSNAEAAAAALKRDGIKPTLTLDPQGRHLLRVGPFATFNEVRAMKQRLADKYPDALILP
jgi:tetratricopeptide (TPR) repeat protein